MWQQTELPFVETVSIWSCHVCDQFRYIFFSFFFNLIRSQRKSGLHINVVFVATSVVVFIAFCAVLGLYVKGNVQFNMITRNIVLTLNGCIMLVELHFTWNTCNTEDAAIDCISLLILLLKIIQQIYKSRPFIIIYQVACKLYNYAYSLLYMCNQAFPNSEILTKNLLWIILCYI